MTNYYKQRWCNQCRSARFTSCIFPVRSRRYSLVLQLLNPQPFFPLEYHRPWWFHSLFSSWNDDNECTYARIVENRHFRSILLCSDCHNTVQCHRELLDAQWKTKDVIAKQPNISRSSPTAMFLHRFGSKLKIRLWKIAFARYYL